MHYVVKIVLPVKNKNLRFHMRSSNAFIRLRIKVFAAAMGVNFVQEQFGTLDVLLTNVFVVNTFFVTVE